MPTRKKPAKKKLELTATTSLRRQLDAHIAKRTCFSCKKKKKLQVSHIYRKKHGQWETGKKGNLRSLCRFYVARNREEKFENKILSEANKCGLLCTSCHRVYDYHYLYGHKKAPFDEEYRKHGVAAAGWQEWKSDCMGRSASFDSKFAKL